MKRISFNNYQGLPKIANSIIWRVMLLFFLSVSINTLTLLAQQPAFSFQSKLSADTILIGDQVELSIIANVPKGFDIQFPFFADTLVKGVEVLGTPKIDTLKTRSGDQQFLYKLRLTSFDEDSYRIPRIRLPFSDGQTIDTALTSPLWLTVLSLPPDSTVTSIFDIKPPISEPITFAEIAPWLGGGLLLAAIIFGIILLLSRRKKNQPLFFPRKPVDPPHVVALRELNKIKEQKLWVTDNHKHYYTLLTDVIRSYIEGRFDVPAMEQTTMETIGSLRAKKLTDEELIRKLDEVLSLSDLVKFARFTTNVSENERSLDFGFRFVNETKVEVPVEDENGMHNPTSNEPLRENNSSDSTKSISSESSKN